MKELQQLTVLISCPSDCEEYKDVVVHTMSLVNQFTEAFLGAQFAHLYYAENLPTGSAAEAQAVISEHIRQNFDVYTGIFWSKLGTPTKEFRSGAVEELEIAHRTKSSTTIGVHVYISEATMPHDIWRRSDPKGIEWLKEHLRESGTLYRPFSETAELQSALATDLVNDLKRQRGLAQDPSSMEGKKQPTEAVGPDAGSIETYLQNIAEGFKALTLLTVSISDSMRSFNEGLENRSKEMTRIAGMGKPYAIKVAMKGVKQRIRGDMDVLDQRLREHVLEAKPIAESSILQLEMMTGILGWVRELHSIRDYYSGLHTLRSTIATSASQHIGAKGSLVRYPVDDWQILKSKMSLYEAYREFEALLISLMVGIDKALLIYDKVKP